MVNNSSLTRSRPIEILLVEDNPGSVRLTLEALKDCNVPSNVSIAKDGEEALAMLRRQDPSAHTPRPDIILLDLNMPKKDGRELLGEIRKDPNLEEIPVVILTTSKAEEDVQKTYGLKANYYFVKPIDLKQFINIVQSIVNIVFH